MNRRKLLTTLGAAAVFTDAPDLLIAALPDQ